MKKTSESFLIIIFCFIFHSDYDLGFYRGCILTSAIIILNSEQYIKVQGELFCKLK